MLSAALACSGNDGTFLEHDDMAPASLLAPEEFFSMSRLVEIEIEMAPGSWDALRREGRDVIEVYDRSAPLFEYTYFDATVTIDGQPYEDVAVRKKGYWGSLSVVRPSLKLDLDRYVPGREHLGLDKLTLNNGRADPSRVRECMAYRLFADAGLPASRCNLAHVVVNGQDLGTYSNVESIDKQMLARHFRDDDGNLYEGQLSDFTRADLSHIELKTNEKKNDRSDLLALVDALEASDDELVERLGTILDIERFRDFWALELLTGQWDGYTNNANNYFAYHDPASGLFTFLPWGTDNSFEVAVPRRLYASGRVAARLYSLPEQRQLFWSRYAELAEAVWDADALSAHIDQVAAFAPDARADLLEEARLHVGRRLPRLRSAFGSSPPSPPGPRTKGPCYGTVGDIRGSFDTVFGDDRAPASEPGSFGADLTLDGAPAPDASWAGHAGLDRARPGAVAEVHLVGDLSGGREVRLDLFIDPRTFEPGTRRFHGAETYGLVNLWLDGAERYVGVIGSGTLDLVEASLEPGSPLRGSFDAHLYQFGCAWK